MFTAKPKISFSNVKDADLDQKAHQIVQSMTGNANFATPTTPLADVQAALTAFTTALAIAGNGSQQDTVLKNQARDVLESLLVNLGLYVQMTANGDLAKLLSSGYDLTKPPTPYGVLAKPENFKVNAVVVKGSVQVSLKSVAGANSYQYEYTEMPITTTSNWKVRVDTSASITITNLVSGTEYAFRVTAVGSDPTRVYSDVLSSFVL